MKEDTIKLPPNVVPLIVGLLSIAAGIYSFATPERNPAWIAVTLTIMGLAMISQFKSIRLERDKISIRRPLIGKQKVILKADIDKIFIGDLRTMNSFAKKPKMLTMRLLNKRNVNITTSNITHSDFQRLADFFAVHYKDKIQ